MQLNQATFSIPKGNPSTIRLHKATAMATGNTNIPRFLDILEYSGGSMKYTDSPVFGMAIHILETGIYYITMSFQDGNASGSFGITKNSSELSTSVGSLTNLKSLLAYGSYPASGVYGSCSATVPLNGGDIIRGHLELTTNGAAADQMFVITRVA